MLRNHRVLAVAVLALAASTLAVGAGACTSCNPPATASEGEGSPGEGEGSPGEGEGEGSPGEGEGEGPVDAGVVDAGPLDPDAVGLDSRPANTTCHAPARPAPTGALDTVTPWPNLQVRSPVLMLQEPGTNNMVVVERGGTLVRFDKDNAAVTIPDLFADFTNLVNTTDNGSDERGLLGLAFHPDWPDVPEIYVSYSGTGGNTGLTDNVSRFTLGSDGTIDEHTEQKLISFSDPASNHNGGMIAFSPTDPCRTCLYSGVGDGGGGDGQFGTSQDTSVLLSKMIRIDVDGTTSAADAANDPCATPGVGLNYGIPADNPFVGNSAFCPEIYAYGLRNPWRWSFDRESGDQWVGDVGQNQHEEVDQLVAGGNYGWNVFEGFACHSADNTTDPGCNHGGYLPPVVTYNHTGGGAPRVAIMGGYVYRGTAIPSLVGTYLYADFGSGEVFTLNFDNSGNAISPDDTSDVVAITLPSNVASFSEDAAGELYVLDVLGGSIRKIVAVDAGQTDDFPQDLSATGCVDPNDPTQVSPGIIPYTVNSPLYSDGAVKQRFAALPDGAKATILPDGDIDFPIGTVFMKNFNVAGQRVETRLLVHHDDGDWAGYSYEWNDAETDAHLVPFSGTTRTLANGQVWTYPARNGCLECHSLAAHRQLGWEIAQLNGGFVYPETGRFANQLHTLDSIGVFDSALPGDPATLPVLLPSDNTTAPIEQVARSYLHVNCAICHRPGGIGVADTDWRIGTDFAAMGLCNAAPTEGDLGVSGALRMVPGDPAHSLVSLRMKKLGAGRMPLLGSTIVDAQGTAVMDSWISSVAACP